MKNLFKGLLLLVSLTVVAQKKQAIDVELTRNNDETINGKMRIFTALFDKSTIDIISFLDAVILVDDNGKKIERIKAINIKELKFTDFKGNANTYFNDSSSRLKKLVYVGPKIKWHKEFSISAFDGSVSSTEVFINENNEKVSVGLFNSLKKKLKEITKSKSELASEIENVNYSDESIMSIIKKYEEE